MPSGSSVESIKCPRQELNLAFDLRRVACESGTLRGQISLSPAPRRGIEPRLAVSRTAVLIRHTRKAFSSEPVSRPGVEPGLRPSEGRVRSTTPSGHPRADDWIRASISRFTRPVPFSIERRRHFSSKHERAESNPVGRFGRPLAHQEHTRVKAPGHWRRGAELTSFPVPRSSRLR